jgi:hypothetical protein
VRNLPVDVSGLKVVATGAVNGEQQTVPRRSTKFREQERVAHSTATVETGKAVSPPGCLGRLRGRSWLRSVGESDAGVPTNAGRRAATSRSFCIATAVA